MKHDLWFELQDRDGVPNAGRIRLMLQWVYSKVQYFSEYLSKWDETLVKDVEEKEQIEKFIKQLESPFGFLENLEAAHYYENDNDDDEEQVDPNTGMPKPKTALE
jgi:hypothetical protein